MDIFYLLFRFDSDHTHTHTQRLTHTIIPDREVDKRVDTNLSIRLTSWEKLGGAMILSSRNYHALFFSARGWLMRGMILESVNLHIANGCWKDVNKRMFFWVYDKKKFKKNQTKDIYYREGLPDLMPENWCFVGEMKLQVLAYFRS